MASALPSGRGAEAGVGLRSPTDAPSAEGSIGQQDPVPDTDAEAAAGASGADSSVAERQPGDAPREPSADGAADAEGSRSGAGTVPEQAAAAAGEQQDAAGAATATAGGGPGEIGFEADCGDDPDPDNGRAMRVIVSPARHAVSLQFAQHSCHRERTRAVLQDGRQTMTVTRRQS